jgi:hypothetical protein
VLDLSFVDRIEKVTNEEALEFARRPTREAGILSGISSSCCFEARRREAGLEMSSHSIGDNVQDQCYLLFSIGSKSRPSLRRGNQNE